MRELLGKRVHDPSNVCAKKIKNNSKVQPFSINEQDLMISRNQPELILNIGDSIPDFMAKIIHNGEIKHKSLSQITNERKWLVLFFFPRDYTFNQPEKIYSFMNYCHYFNEINCEVIGCSTDSEYSLLAWSKLPLVDKGLALNSTNLYLMSDLNYSISKVFSSIFPENRSVDEVSVVIIDERSKLRLFHPHIIPNAARYVHLRCS